jgi:ribonuclease HI
MDPVNIFTDGSSVLDKKTKKRYGGSGVFFPTMEKLNIVHSLKFKNPTNQVAELKACLLAIKKCVSNGITKMVIFSDSMYAINSITIWAINWEKNGWKRKIGSQFKKISNLALIKKLYEYYQNKDLNIKFVHVRSHCKEPEDNKSYEWFLWHGNDQADKLAKQGMEKSKILYNK